MTEETGAQPQDITNAVLKVELNQQGAQLKSLWDLNRDQTVQLAKLSDVPGKLDRLLELNTSMAVLVQQGQQHSVELAGLKSRVTDCETSHTSLDKKVSSKFSYYAGAMAICGLIAGVACWAGEQAITAAFAKIAEVDHTISEIHGDVDMLKFKTNPK